MMYSHDMMGSLSVSFAASSSLLLLCALSCLLLLLPLPLPASSSSSCLLFLFLFLFLSVLHPQAAHTGLAHIMWSDMQERYCGGDATANFVLPTISFTRDNKDPPVRARLASYTKRYTKSYTRV